MTTNYVVGFMLLAYDADMAPRKVKVPWDFSYEEPAHNNHKEKEG